MIEIRKLSLAYGQHRALRDVDIDVATGETVVLLGANGAGKSSLLKALSGLVPALPGSVLRHDGVDLTRLQAHQIVEAGIALVPEGRGIFGQLTVRENLQLGAHAKRARATERKNLEQVLALFPKLEQRMQQMVSTMSGGEQQMVAIGRALMSAPDTLLLDEPSLGLSPIMTGDLFKSLRRVREIGISILLVEQNARKSLAIADRGYLIENGAIVGSGSAQQLMHDPAVQHAYLGAAATT